VAYSNNVKQEALQPSFHRKPSSANSRALPEAHPFLASSLSRGQGSSLGFDQWKVCIFFSFLFGEGYCGYLLTSPCIRRVVLNVRKQQNMRKGHPKC
jgi:hypothetical protein